MKAFFVGLLFIFVVLAMTGIGIVLMPLLFVLHIFLRVLIGIGLIILAIWLLGKFILFVWKKIK